jgi:DNA-binding MarR family transcriptional regulator
MDAFGRWLDVHGVNELVTPRGMGAIMSDTRLRADLDLLVEVERSGAVTQLSLAKRVGVAVGLLNALLRRAVRKGYIKVRHVPPRRYVYYLSPKGFVEKSRLVAAYIHTSLGFFRQAREEYSELFEEARERGFQRIALAGTGELAEIAIIAASQAEVELLAILDSATNRMRFAGLPVVRSLDEIDQFDAVMLTDSRSAQEVYMRMRKCLPASKVLAPPMLRVLASDDPKTGPINTSAER